jgi:phenylalanyl-tRNA synthetase alpha chain
MIDKIKHILEEASAFAAKTQEEAEAYRIKYLSKKGVLNQLFEDFKELPSDLKKQSGQKLNELKETLTTKYNDFKTSLESSTEKTTKKDLSLPGDQIELGSRHPNSIVRNEINEIFSRIGFTIAEGPEIEDDWHVFSALNFPQEHPARDMQDTFFIAKDPEILLRTHTSSVQVRLMEKTKPPIRSIMPGRVFRNEAISARSHCFFHQVEGLYIDKNVSFADLKQTLLFFAREFFGHDTQIRLRPSYFPFTEPSAEMDISCTICKGKGCNICKHSGWLEILGCGMVDPNVLKNCGIDPSVYSGYAFGMGIDRMALLKYQIKDIRILFENDKRFLEQFASTI